MDYFSVKYKLLNNPIIWSEVTFNIIHILFFEIKYVLKVFTNFVIYTYLYQK